MTEGSGDDGRGPAGLRAELEGPAPTAVFAGLLAAGCGVVAATLGDYGLASDVVNYFRSSLRQIDWIAGFADALVDGRWGAWLEPGRVFEHWRWWPVRIPHPPLSRELGALSYVALSDVVDPITAYRGAVGATFAALAAFVGAFTHRCRGSLAAGIGAGLGVAAVPAVFAYGNLALTDMFLTAFWFFSVGALELHLRTERRSWLAASALFFGAAVATKFTGLLVGPVLGLWLVLRRALTWKRAAALAAGGAGVFVLVNPVMWVDPVQGLADYLGAGFERSESEAARIVTHYLGEVYEYRPPWHYPFVWTAVVIPVPVWIAVAVGAVDAWRTRLGALCAVNLAVAYGALMVPAAPMHDGIRLFLPAFPFFALLAGLAVPRVGRWADRVLPDGLRRRADLVAALFLIGTVGVGLLQTARYHPYQLSYFNAFVGGVDGAEEAGLEISPLKEALTPEVLGELSERIPAGSVVDPDFFMEEMCFYRQRGRIPDGWTLEAEMEHSAVRGPVTLVCLPESPYGVHGVRREPEPPEFVMLLNRRGTLTEGERALWRFGGDPFFELRLQGVALLRVYRLQGS